MMRCEMDCINELLGVQPGYLIIIASLSYRIVSVMMESTDRPLSI